MSKYDVNELIELAKRQNDEKYWENYTWLKKHSEDPFFGRFFRAKMNDLEAAENERYWDDYFRNTGLDRDSVKYPIRAGLYNSVSSGNAAFEASKAVMSLYGKWWK